MIVKSSVLWGVSFLCVASLLLMLSMVYRFFDKTYGGVPALSFLLIVTITSTLIAGVIADFILPP